MSGVGGGDAYDVVSDGVRPVLYLSSDITLSGMGTQSNPYKIDGVTTNSIELPTFSEKETSTGKDVTITYPNGCGSTYTCSYIKNNGTETKVTGITATMTFTESGNVVAKVSDGINSISSSYTVV